MTITVTTLTAGPFTPTGLAQSLPFDFKVHDAAELEVVQITGAGVETTVDPGDYSVEINEDATGAAIEGGSVELGVGAASVPAGNLYVRALPSFEQGQVWDDDTSSLRNLNEALDRGALRDIHMRDRIITSEEALAAFAGDVATVAANAAQTTADRVQTTADRAATAADRAATADKVSASALAGIGGALLVAWKANGVGAVLRTLQAWLLDQPLSVKSFGAVGDGTTDDAPAFNAALTASVGGLAGRAVYVPGSNARYKIGSTIVVPGGARLYGDGHRSSSFLIKAFNGTFITLDDGSQLHGLRMDGVGATYTGKGIEHIGGNQQVTDLFIYDTQDTAVYFTVTSGANCHYENVTAYMYGSALGSGVTPGTLKWAFKIEDSATAPGGTPRHFVNIKTGGKESFYFGASNNTLISASALYDLGWPVYSAGVREYSRNVTIVGCRIASAANLNIYGSGNIVGCDVGSKVSLKPTTVFSLGPNIYNNGWEDVSGTGDNLVYSTNDIDYTPVCYAGGTPITLGDGSIIGRYSREGRTIRAMIRFLPGASTSFGAGGQLSFSLPHPTSFAYNQVDVHGRFEATSGTMYRINGRIAAAASVVLLERDTTGSVTSTAPGTMAVTGAITMAVVYDV